MKEESTSVCVNNNVVYVRQQLERITQDAVHISQ